MSNDPSQFLSEIPSIPIGDMITSVGEGVAKAQAALDEASIRATLAIYEEHGDEGLKLLQSIGYQPNFYGLRNVQGKLRIALSIVGERSATGVSPRLFATATNPSLQNKYSFSGESSSEISFEIVPIPPVEAIRRVPVLTGKTALAAKLLLDEIGLNAIFEDNAGNTLEPTNTSTTQIVSQQQPEAGKIVKVDTNIILTLGGN